MYRLLLYLFLLSLPNVIQAQSPLEQRIDFEVVDRSLTETLIELSQQTEINIAFSNQLIPTDAVRTINLQQTSIRAILQELLQDTNITFKEVDDQIILYKRPPPPARKFTISGYIKDKTTGEGLIGAYIVDARTNTGTATNNYGYFSITVKEGLTNFMISYIGYETETLRLDIKQKSRLTIELNPSSVESTPIIVTASETSSILTDLESPSRENFNIDQIQNLPSLGGEVDINRAAHLLSGVQTGADGVGGLIIRGGNFDQNLVLLDGATIFNPSHALGIISVFNMDAAKSVQLYKGAFPARYAGRLSSILDIRTKEGNMRKISGSTTWSLLAGKMLLEGPIIKDKLSFIISARRSLTDLYTPFVSKKAFEAYLKTFEEGTLSAAKRFSNYSFYDINAKINLQLTKRDQIYCSVYTGEDEFFNQSSFAYQDTIYNPPPLPSIADFINIQDTLSSAFSWGNRMLTFRWNRLWGDRLFSNITTGQSEYRFSSDEIFRSIGNYIFNSINDEIISAGSFNLNLTNRFVKAQLEYNLNANNYLRFGANLGNYSFQPGVIERSLNAQNVINLKDSILLINALDIEEQEAIEFDLFIENDIRLGKKWKMNLGLHYARWMIDEAQFQSFQPRIHLQYAIHPKLQLLASYGKMMQPLHFLTKSNLGLPGDIWVPATASAPPEKSTNATLGVQYKGEKGYQFSVEGYYKQMDNLISFLDNDSLLIVNADDWEQNIATGEGKAYGLEVNLHKNKGKLQGFVNYTYSFADRQFDEINNGERFEFRYNSVHNGKLALLYQFNPKWSCSLNWIIQSTSNTTLPISTYPVRTPFGPVEVFNITDENTVDLPGYQRLDINMKRTIQKNKLIHTLNFGAYNVYNRQENFLFYSYRVIDDSFTALSLLPILPSFSYTLEFGK